MRIHATQSGLSTLPAPWGEDVAADTSLIVAAPALFAALELAEQFASGFEGDELQDGIDEMLAAMRDAIAQARGETPSGEVARAAPTGETEFDQALYWAREYVRDSDHVNPPSPEQLAAILSFLDNADLCLACGRHGPDCSADPCPDVIADRGDEPCPINRRPKSTCPDSCNHGEA